MANSYYTPGGYPGLNQFGSSASMRAELAAIQAAFDKFPSPGSAKGFAGGSFISPTVSGGTLDGVTIGASVPGTAAFTRAYANNDAIAGNELTRLSQVSALIASNGGSARSSALINWTGNTTALAAESLLVSSPSSGLILGNFGSGTVNIDRNINSRWFAGTYTVGAGEGGLYLVSGRAFVLNSGNVQRQIAVYPYISGAYKTTHRVMELANKDGAAVSSSIGFMWLLQLTAGQTLQVRAWDANGASSQLPSGYTDIYYLGS